ncbi:MAG: divalent-cation tolerance protein CutA [bacterium]
MGQSSRICLVRTTLGSKDTAREIARELVEKRLAACVQVGTGVQTFYHWENEMQVETEIPLLIKTSRESLQKLERWIDQNHPYDTPEFLVSSVDQSSEGYEDWVKKQTI